MEADGDSLPGLGGDAFSGGLDGTHCDSFFSTMPSATTFWDENDADHRPFDQPLGQHSAALDASADASGGLLGSVPDAGTAKEFGGLDMSSSGSGSLSTAFAPFSAAAADSGVAASSSTADSAATSQITQQAVALALQLQQIQQLHQLQQFQHLQQLHTMSAAYTAALSQSLSGSGALSAEQLTALAHQLLAQPPAGTLASGSGSGGTGSQSQLLSGTHRMLCCLLGIH